MEMENERLCVWEKLSCGCAREIDCITKKPTGLRLHNCRLHEIY